MKRIVTLAVILAGCEGRPTAPELSQLIPPPAETMAPSKPLPDIPSCDAKPTRREQIACRASYDYSMRTQCIRTAEEKDTLSAWIRETVSR